MWYAPIGSIEYVTNLHNDILIKKYILSEQRFKQQNRLNLQSVVTLGEAGNTNFDKTKQNSALNASKSPKKENVKLDNETRINRIKGCAVDIQIKRSFKKTHLDVVTYDSMFSQ